MCLSICINTHISLRSIPHGGTTLVGFFGYPRSGAGKTIVAKGACFGLDLGFFGKCLSETFEGEAGPP